MKYPKIINTRSSRFTAQECPAENKKERILVAVFRVGKASTVRRAQHAARYFNRCARVGQ